ncbi:Nuclear pore complex protein Nup160 [Nesidiocoris tenuis]|nr:Nuclear pore complex protein Nup160 [Nesidiocoris tenuis]
MTVTYSPEYKEVFLRVPPNDDWNEITLNTGGVPSTLQDVNAQQWSGGFAYRQISNRFIYWRSVHNVIELVEESLDIQLVGNQVRYKFADSQVLNGISITELPQHVVVLVPTVSSLHRFTFPHPDKKNQLGLSSHSIFHGTSVADAMDSSSYHVLKTTPCGISHAASCVSDYGDAIFALALANTSVLLARMSSDTLSTAILSHHSLMPRFIGGLKDALLRKECTPNSSAAMVFHSVNKNIYLFSLVCQGVLNVWDCQSGSSLSSINLSDHVPVPFSPSNKHQLMKGFVGKTPVFYCYLHGCCLIAVSADFSHGTFEFEIDSITQLPRNSDLISMTMGSLGDIWCCWMATGDESALITSIKRSELGKWPTVSLSRPPTSVKNSHFLSQDPASLFLDSIFTSGYFTTEGIRKALMTYESNASIKQKSDLKSFICNMVETEIYLEIRDQPVDDHVFLRVAERCWSRIYSCCSQHIIAGSLIHSLLWLGDDNLILIQDSGFSLATRCDFLDLFWNFGAKLSSHPVLTIASSGSSYAAQLLEIARDLDLSAAVDFLMLELQLGQQISAKALDDAIKFVPPDDNLPQKFSQISPDVLRHCFLELFNMLSINDDAAMSDAHDWKAFCGPSGLAAISRLFREYVSTRLKVCLSLMILMALNGRKFNVELSKELSKFCSIYYVLHWTCTTNVNIDTPIIENFIVSHQSQIMLSSLEDSVKSLLKILWPKKGNEALVNHLFSIKQHMLIQQLFRISPQQSGSLILAESYLATGEYAKAYDVCMDRQGDNLMAQSLEVIRLFEQHSRPDLAISVARNVLNSCGRISSTDMEIIQSVLFIHLLQLKHYGEAYAIIESCNSWHRKMDSLHRFILSLIADGKLEELTSYSYIGIVDQFDNFLSTRARSLPFNQAISYYNILYAFHVKQGDFKRAASVMFEKGMRSDSCEMQWMCFGACLTCLSVVDSQDAFILRPVAALNPNENSIEVLNISEVRKEFELSGARYNLIDCPPDATKDEVVAICVSKRQYKVAMRLVTLCSLSGAQVIESLANACATMKGNDDWQWVANNEIDDMLVSKENAQDMAWRVLRRFIERYENDKFTELHRAAAHKLLGLKMFLPAWLVSSYCKRNANELLKLYLNHGYLDECSSLAVNILNAGMGVGYEAFGLDSPLHPDSAPIWIPLFTINRVLKELQHYKLEAELEKTLDDYINLTMRTSNDKQISHRGGHRMVFA